MAKRSSKKEEKQAGKNSPMLYGVVLLIAGALIGGVVSTALQSTSRQAAAPAQQGGDMFAQIKAYSDRVALNPKDGAAWVSLGNLYFDTNQPAKSVEAYGRALEINPGNPNVLTDMGVMHRALGEYQKALDAFARAMEADPSHETARMNTGVVLLHDMGDKAGAIKAWQELVRINPQARNAEGRLVADMLRQMGGSVNDAGTGSEAGPRLLVPGGGS